MAFVTLMYQDLELPYHFSQWSTSATVPPSAPESPRTEFSVRITSTFSMIDKLIIYNLLHLSLRARTIRHKLDLKAQAHAPINGSHYSKTLFYISTTLLPASSGRTFKRYSRVEAAGKSKISAGASWRVERELKNGASALRAYTMVRSETFRVRLNTEQASSGDGSCHYA